MGTIQCSLRTLWKHSLEAIVTVFHEVQLRARFKAPEAGRLTSVCRLGVAISCSIYCAGQVEEECRHLRHYKLKEQKSQELLAEGMKHVQADCDKKLIKRQFIRCSKWLECRTRVPYNDKDWPVNFIRVVMNLLFRCVRR